MKFQSACQPARQVLAGGSDWEKCEDHAKHWRTCLETERWGWIAREVSESEIPGKETDGGRWQSGPQRGRIKVESYWDRDNIRKENWTTYQKQPSSVFPGQKHILIWSFSLCYQMRIILTMWEIKGKSKINNQNTIWNL